MNSRNKIPDVDQVIGRTEGNTDEECVLATRAAAHLAARCGASPAELADVLGSLGLLSPEQSRRAVTALGGLVQHSTPSDTTGTQPERLSETCMKGLHDLTRPGSRQKDGRCRQCRLNARRGGAA